MWDYERVQTMAAMETIGEQLAYQARNAENAKVEARMYLPCVISMLAIHSEL